MTEKKIDPTRYAGLAPEEKVRRIAEDEHRAINESPAVVSAVRDLERRQAEERAEQQRATVRNEDLQQRRYTEALDAHYRDRREFYRLAKGTPGEVFDEVIWPKLIEQFLLGEEDAVDRERRERATDVY